jgi:3'(2'), 5'-bisphosphate nucleotidase
MSMYAPEIETALAAATEAGQHIMAFYEKLEPILGATSSITTQADKDSQDIILSRLYAAFPKDGFMGEEETPLYLTLPHSGRRMWIVDPIDGTKGFALKVDQFCIMIALVENGEPVVGVVHDPANGRTTYAAKGAGCYAIDSGKPALPCKVSQTNSLSEAVVTKTHSKAKGKTEGLSSHLGAKGLYETYSAGLKLARIARGEADVYVNDYPTYHDWDICAGHILVTEAGGKVSDLKDRPLMYGNRSGPSDTGFMASNGIIHSEGLERLKGHFG